MLTCTTLNWAESMQALMLREAEGGGKYASTSKGKHTSEGFFGRIRHENYIIGL